MKDFFKQVFATMVGIFLFGFVMFVFAFISIIGMAVMSLSNSNTIIEDNSVLVINLSGSFNERAEKDYFAELTGETSNNIGLEEFVKGVKRAKTDDRIKGIYLEAGAFAPNSYATLQEAREVLEDFKKSGKWIVAYGDSYGQGTYYLSSVANKVYINPKGQIDWRGLASERVFLKDVMEKFGVKMQIAKVGTYKSATEQFTGDKMSDADRQQTTAYMNALWKNVLSGVSQSRNIPATTLNTLADNMLTLAPTEEYKRLKLVDGLYYADQMKAEVKKLLKVEQDDAINQVTLSDLQGGEEEGFDNQVAVYYAYGDIVDGNVGGMFADQYIINSQKVCSDLEALKNDNFVKAVVIRINSGGGSAYGSEQMWHYIMELKKVKPVVVSMGGMAASGGYYMAAPANWIVAEPTTITGSIGIFGMFPDMSNLFTEKLGVKFDEVKTNKHANFGSNARPFNAEEIAILENYIARGYDLFKNRVAQGRKMTVEQVENIAQGHVYAGEDALKIKLVDELGGLDKAIAKASKLAKIDNPNIISYPRPADWYTELFSSIKKSSYLDDQLRAGLGIYYEPFALLKNMDKQAAIQARMPYYLNIK